MRRTLLFVVLAIAIGILAFTSWRRWQDRRASLPVPPVQTVPLPAAELESVPCYFPGRTAMDLVEEHRQRPRRGTPIERLRGALAELHRGPTTPAALPVFPPGLAPRSVFLTPEGVAYLDEPAAAWDRPIGLREEMLVVRSIARTILRHCPEVRALVFLTDGAPRVRLAAHCPAQGKYLLPRLRRDAEQPRLAIPRAR